MEKKSTRDKIIDAVGSARSGVARGVNKVATKITMSENDYKTHLANQELLRKETLAAAHYVNEVRILFVANHSKGVFKLYDGVFAEELADAYSELFNFKRSQSTVLETANNEFFNHIAGDPVDGVNKFYNIDTAIGTFRSVCAMVQANYAKKYKCSSFSDLATHPDDKAKAIYKEFVKYRDKKLTALDALYKRSQEIKQGSTACLAKTGVTYPELLQITAATRSAKGLQQDLDKAQRRADANLPSKGIVEKVARLSDALLAKRARRRKQIKIGAGVTTGVAGAGTVAGFGINAYLDDKARERAEAEWQEQLQDFAENFGFDNIDLLRAFVAEQSAKTDFASAEELFTAAREQAVNEKLTEINTELGTEYQNFGEFLAEATTHTKTINGMTQEQYFDGIVNRKGEVLFEGADMEHERLMDEIYYDFAETNNLLTAEGTVDKDAVNAFVAKYTREDIEVTDNNIDFITDATLFKARVEAEDQRYNEVIDAANSMDWPQDVTYYDGKYSDYINEIENIQDAFSSESSALAHLNDVLGNDTNSERYQAILTSAENRFGDKWEDVVDWDNASFNGADQTPSDAPITDASVADAPAPELSPSDQDIIDAQDIKDGIADAIDKGSEAINNAIDNSVEILQNSIAMNLGGNSMMPDMMIDTNNNGLLDQIGDHLSEIVASSVIISGAVMAARMWLMRHNVVKGYAKASREMDINKEFMEIEEARKSIKFEVPNKQNTTTPKTEQKSLDDFFGKK